MLKKLPKSLVEFQWMFPDETACADYIRELRWPNGFVCPHCGGYQGRQENKRPLLWGCRACGKQTSIAAGTVMHGAKLPLQYWFWAAYLVATHSNGMSALQLKKQLQIGSYKSAWLMLNKLRWSMVDPDRTKLSGDVEVDEAFITFRSKDDPEVDSRGRSTVGKIPILVAVESLASLPKTLRCGPGPDASGSSPCRTPPARPATASSAGTSSRGPA